MRGRILQLKPWDQPTHFDSYFRARVLYYSNLLSEIEYDLVGEVQLALHVIAGLYSEADRRFGAGRQCMFGSLDLVTLD